MAEIENEHLHRKDCFMIEDSVLNCSRCNVSVLGKNRSYDM